MTFKELIELSEPEIRGNGNTAKLVREALETFKEELIKNYEKLGIDR